MDGPLVRIVTMTFPDRRVGEFLALFDSVSDMIRAFPGCERLELLQCHDPSGVFTTYSIWESSERLEAYRSSPLFEETWRATKAMFAEPPVARSYSLVRSA